MVHEVDLVVGAVGVAGPEALGVAEVAIHVLPAVVEDAAVGGQGAVALVERAAPDLVDVRAVAVHPKDIAHDVAVAHAVLRLAGRREGDAAVGQIERVDVGDAGAEGELPEP